jgi:hypothetical protein
MAANAPDEVAPPALVLGVLLVAAIFLVCIGIGIVLALLAAAILAVFVSLGIISVATVTTFLAGWRAGAKAIAVQIVAVAVAPLGILALWQGNRWYGLGLSHLQILLQGGLVGMLAGFIWTFGLLHVLRLILSPKACSARHV